MHTKEEAAAILALVTKAYKARGAARSMGVANFRLQGRSALHFHNYSFAEKVARRFGSPPGICHQGDIFLDGGGRWVVFGPRLLGNSFPGKDCSHDLWRCDNDGGKSTTSNKQLAQSNPHPRSTMKGIGRPLDMAVHFNVEGLPSTSPC